MGHHQNVGREQNQRSGVKQPRVLALNGESLWSRSAAEDG